MPINDQQVEQTLQSFHEGLIKTRRQLQELKRSINQTLSDIRALDILLKETQIRFTQRKLLNLSEPGQTNIQTYVTLKCKKCLKQLQTVQELFSHEKNDHQRCIQCSQVYFETEYDHQNYLCEGRLIKCMDCFAYVQRKNIDKHVKICCFRQCYKCSSKVYIKSFAYHLKVCGKENQKFQDQSTVSYTKSSNSSLQDNKISMFPCTMVR